MDGHVLDFLGHGRVLNDELPFVQSSSLLLRNVHADLRDGESLLLVIFALLSLRRFGAGPFGLFLVTVELSLDLDVQRQVTARWTGLQFSVDPDSQILTQKSLTTDSNDMTTGLLGGVHGSLEFQACLGLLLTVMRLDDTFTDGLEGTGDLRNDLSGLVASLTNGGADEQFSLWVLGDLEQVLDCVLASLLEWALNRVLQLIEGLEWCLLTQKNKDESATTCAFMEGLSRLASRLR